VVSGCSTLTPGNANPAPRSSETDAHETTTGHGSDDLPTDGAPEVENPIDTSRFEDDPCLSLTSAQSDSLDLGASGAPVDAVLGKACQWRNESTRGRAQITFFDRGSRGLTGEYRANADGKWAYFDELAPIDGFPAVARDITDDRHNGGCPVVVGVSDEVTFEVDIQLSQVNVGKSDPCEVAVDVARMAVGTMRG
jgi:hypothetical protein